ncbi:hypothetical protein ABTY20_03890 [Streptomyces sp. NPDC126497]|uniref:hypothetical protein n=1 Tax=Streptomyces sp. NPDC126497 TaxID=3155313 RepID=UPI0033324686
MPEGTPQAPESDLVRWAWEQEPAGEELPASVRALLDCPDDAFVQVPGVTGA